VSGAFRADCAHGEVGTIAANRFATADSAQVLRAMLSVCRRTGIMRRAVHALATEAEWESVSSDHPCPVCSSSRGCSTHSSVFVSCERVSSQWPLTTGAWLHRLAPNSLAPNSGFASGASASVSALRAERTPTALEQAAHVALTAGLTDTSA
jgi:hypothetical protein